MIITRTPFRVSFFGGGTDYPSWYRLHGGAVLSTTIDKYCYLTCRRLPPFFPHRYRIVYSRMENCLRVAEIAHPAVRAILQHLEFDDGLELHHDADLPARSGMGSSSAFAVGMLHAMHALRGRISSKHQLATQALHVEQVLLRETVGSQDQVAAAYGGLNVIEFKTNDDIAVQPLTISGERQRELESHLLLFFSGIHRTASDIADTFVPSLETRGAQLARMREMVDEAAAVLTGGRPMTEFGVLLHEGWQLKRSLGDQVSSPEVDGMYAAARAAGALGGKLLGAGGGGFMLIFAPPERHLAVRAALRAYIHVPFRFEYTGSQVIHYDPEQVYSEAMAERAAGASRPSGDV